MTMQIKNHFLFTDANQQVPFQLTPNQSGPFEKNNLKFLVMHYTAGRSAESSIKWLSNPQSRASAHIVIGRDGSVTQMVPFNKIAWHAGRSEWNGFTGLNKHSIGIELDNAGQLTPLGNRWLAWFGEIYDTEDVTVATHKNDRPGTPPAGWHLFPKIQIETALVVAQAIVDEYNLRDILGHDDIAPFRKVDPGPAFPLRSFRSRILGRADNEPTLYQTKVGLNIRKGPGTQHETLIPGGLPKGTRLEILFFSNSWRFVDVIDEVNGIHDLQGWVHGNYIEEIVEAPEG